MQIDKEQFKKDLAEQIQKDYSQSIDTVSTGEIYQSLAKTIRYYISGDWIKCKDKVRDNLEKQVYYFSMEFMIGRLLKETLLKTGMLEDVTDVLKDFGFKLEDILESEREPGLGNGGLGRLAACFMDSCACLGIPGNGNGIRYNYGMFEQRFSDGNQVEWPDDWLRNKNPWEIRKENRKEVVKFGGTVRMDANLKPIHEGYEIIHAVPYDMPIIGNDDKTINTLRLWSAELILEDSELNSVEYSKLEAKKIEIQKITNVLYPDDSTDEGKLLRLKQEYFFVSAGLQSIMKDFKKLKLSISEFPNKVAVHINDTHPALCIPELIRILLDEEHLEWEEAIEITRATMSYTNHTIMQEALEKWPAHFLKNLLPRIYMILEELDRRFNDKYSSSLTEEQLRNTSIIRDGYVRMANLSVIMSHSTNGVAKLHTDLLKTEVMKDLNFLFPDRFNNKTNGISYRRWIESCNPTLSSLIDETIGKEWRKNPLELAKLNDYKDDSTMLDKIERVKNINKENFSNYMKQRYDFDIDPKSIYDVQIKRFHEYKRQFLNALHILYLYHKILREPDYKMQPVTFIFGGKAASSYYRAKKVIKFINSLAYHINTDPRVKGRIKIYLIPNYNVSLAERIIPATNISEQISTATKEASGTSNMKFMLNGAITLATLDGANIEIKDQVGDDNIMIFGLNKEEVLDYQSNHNYNASDIYQNDQDIKMVVDSLVNGFLPKLGYDGIDLYDSLLKENDRYYVLKDFHSYKEASAKLRCMYKDRKKWNKMSIINTANAGIFSSDETIKRYAKEIWNVNGDF
ncbi:glycogen/starch/alpha-glucan phosphorylase [Peptoanaerobacter stomatis]|uniref:Alpha-1,4 glucan phosphorylase n=1 Tax=Peptoanaerobacter stomatis TaxID=796937 RepID=V9HKG6_9FIRM|nr:glycogen/starch/alpha-glucan phosphorylase [Peptoanaerobacter stomatis]EHL17309.1 glycogen/starch/alpha-glucan phosphorylase [Peptoanaerobacter stomatis]